MLLYSDLFDDDYFLKMNVEIVFQQLFTAKCD